MINYVCAKTVPDSTKLHLMRGPKFPGGACPQTPLVSHMLCTWIAHIYILAPPIIRTISFYPRPSPLAKSWRKSWHFWVLLTLKLQRRPFFMLSHLKSNMRHPSSHSCFKVLKLTEEIEEVEEQSLQNLYHIWWICYCHLLCIFEIPQIWEHICSQIYSISQ